MMPSEGIEALLDAVTPDIVNGATGWPTRIGRLSSSSDRCVAILDRGGPRPEAKVAIDYPSVQVLVRGQKADYALSRSKAESIKTALHAIDTPAAPYPELASCLLANEITWVGYDTDGDRPVWSLNLTLITSTGPVGYRT